MILTAERIVDGAAFLADPSLAAISSLYVDAVVEVERCVAVRLRRCTSLIWNSWPAWSIRENGSIGRSVGRRALLQPSAI